jgi:5-methylcytosine-specific restriction protein A
MFSLLHRLLGTLKLAPQRSPHWKAVEKAFLAGKTCAACDGKKNLQAHHEQPFHLFPERECDPANLIALCMAPGRWCHLRFGHGFDWKAFCPDVRERAAASLASIQGRQYAR